MFEKKNFYDLMLSMPIASTSLFNTLNPVYNNQNNPGKPAHLLCLREFLYYHTHLLLSSPLAIGFHRQSPQYKNLKTLNDTLNDLNSEVINQGNSRKHFFSIFLNIKETIKKISFNQPQYGLILFKLKFKDNSAIVGFLVWLASLTCDRFVNVKSGEPAAVFVFLPEIKVVELNLPESAAAGLLFPNEPSHHYPNPPTPHFHEPIHTPKTRINNYFANYEYQEDLR